MTTPPQTRLLHRAGGIHVFHRPGNSPWTLVAFGPRQAVVREDQWWGSSLGQRQGVDLIGVVTTDHDWFPRDLMESVLPAIRTAARPDLMTYGVGMGGYGALKYAAALGARGALGICAHFSIDPEDVMMDEQVSQHFDPARHAGMRIAPGDYPDGAMLLWDPAVDADDLQARPIVALPGIRAVPLRLAGPAPALLLSETRQFVPVCEHVAAGRVEQAVGAIRQARRQSPTVLLSVAAMLEAHGHARWARAAHQRAEAQRPGVMRGPAVLRPGRLEADPSDPHSRSEARPRQAEAVSAQRSEPVLLAETESLRLWFCPGRGPASLVVFTPRSAAPADPTDLWMRDEVVELGWNTLVFAAHSQTWYPGAEMEALLPQALAALPRGPRIAFGAGMGGYAALKFARALSAKASVAFSPVFSLDPAAMPRDPRAHRQFDPERNRDMTVRRTDLPRFPVIAYDPLVLPDRIQARRLALMPRVLAVPMRRGGSGLAAILAEAGGIVPLLRAALAEEGPGAVAALREARRRSPTLRKAIAAAAEARGHARWAAALRDAAPAAVATSPPAPISEPVLSDRHFAVQVGTLRRQRRYDAEEALLRRWIATNPAAAGPRVGLAQCLQRRNQPQAAAQSLFEAIRDGVRDEPVLAALVGMLSRLERDEETAAAAAGALAAAPSDAATLALAGHVALWSRQPAEAERAFLAALALEPTQRMARWALAMLEPDPAPEATAGPYLAALLAQMEEGQAPEAEWLLLIDRLSHSDRVQASILVGEAALALHPGAARLVLRQGRNLIATGRGGEAIVHCRRLIEVEPRQVRSWLGLIDALWQMKQYQQVQAVAVEAMTVHPEDAILVARHANALLVLDQGAAAEREARRAIALDPAAEEGHLALIDVLRRQERIRDALATARQAMEALPEAPHIAQRLGRMLLEREEYAEAVEVHERLIAMLPKPSQAIWVGLAEALAAAGRPDEAEAAVRRGLEADPGAQELRGLLGQMLLLRGEAEAARTALAQAIDEEAGSSAVSLAMVDALLRQSRNREALALLESAVASAPGHVPTEIRLGQLLLEAGRVEEAGALFTRLTEADPSLAMAWVGLSDAERLRKRVKPALAAYRAAIAAGVDAKTLRNLRYRLFGEYDG